MAIPEAQRITTTDDTLRVYRERGLNSPVLAELAKGVEIEVDVAAEFEGREWMKATLKDGTFGFVLASSVRGHTTIGIEWAALAEKTARLRKAREEAECEAERLAKEAEHEAERLAKDGREVRTWIARNDGQSLKANWATTKRVLLKDLESRDFRRERAVETLIRLGCDDVVWKLARALPSKEEMRTNVLLKDEDGRAAAKRICEILLNCGNSFLEQQAKNWADYHGYFIEQSSGSIKVRWGTM
jgi:hypothetical protein